MKEKISLFDVVALREDLPDLGLRKGLIGTVLEEYEPGVFEVEFSDEEGQMYAMETLHSEQLVVLHHYPVEQQIEAAIQEYGIGMFEIEFRDDRTRLHAMETSHVVLHHSVPRHKTSYPIGQVKITSWPSADEQEQISSNKRPLLPSAC